MVYARLPAVRPLVIDLDSVGAPSASFTCLRHFASMKKEKAVSLDDGTGMVARWRRCDRRCFTARESPGGTTKLIKAHRPRRTRDVYLLWCGRAADAAPRACVPDVDVGRVVCSINNVPGAGAAAPAADRATWHDSRTPVVSTRWASARDTTSQAQTPPVTFGHAFGGNPRSTLIYDRTRAGRADLT